MGWGQSRSGSPHYGGKPDSFIDSKIVATKWKQITDWNNRCGCINWVQCFYILFTFKAAWGRTVSPLTEHELTSQRCLIKPPLMTPSKEHQLCTPNTPMWPQLLLTASLPPENASLWLQIRDDKLDPGPTPPFPRLHEPFLISPTLHITHITFLALQSNSEQFQTNHPQHADIIHHVSWMQLLEGDLFHNYINNPLAS